LRGDAHRPGKDRGPLCEQCGDTGMRLVRGPVHLACLGFEVAIEDFRHCQCAEQMTAFVAKRNDRTLLQRSAVITGRQRDRQRPRRAIAERGVLDDARVVTLALKTVDGRVGATAEEREIGRCRLGNTQ
jgi:hypothetical protein